MPTKDGFLLAAVMGWPISQSRSPMLHNYWFEQHKLAGTYVPLAIPPERLRSRAARPAGAQFRRLQPDHPAQAGCDEDRRRGRRHRQEDRRDLLRDRAAAMARYPAATTTGTASSTTSWNSCRTGVRRRPGRRDGRRRRRPRRGLRPDGARRERNQTLQPHSMRGRVTLAKEFGGPITVLPWEERHDAHRGRHHAGQRHQSGHDRPGGARSQARQAAEIGAGQRHHLHPARDAADRGAHVSAATAPSPGSACCCTRAFRPGRPGSASSPR